MNRSPLIVVCLLLTLTGCRAPGLERGPVAASPSAPPGWVVRAGNWPGAEEYRIQLVTFRDSLTDTTHLIRYDINLTNRRLTMAAQTTLGIPLYETTLIDGVVTIERHIAELARIPLEQALADFLLANWPIEQLAVALESDGYTIREENGVRRLLDSTGALQLEVLTAASEAEQLVRVIHHDIPLEITIHTLAREPIKP